mgnify:FL=1
MASEEYALLIDFEWCTGCYACVVAGRNANHLDYSRACITIGSGERKVGGRVILDFVPEPTNLCNLCAPRTRLGLAPACVHHCPPCVIRYGPKPELDELQKQKPSQSLWSLGGRAG